MSDILWCPVCRKAVLEEPRIFFAQRCEDCGGLLEAEQERAEVDFKEIDIGYVPEEEEVYEDEEADEEAEDQEDSDEAETEGEAE
ncbi:hypothetical protein EI171_08325 [Bradyrhizobium sp. LCT2]|uniref:hypothetical protein n=1 Tax=Bradyrhizobium sp. LCT2 TaxID=2493093 RepID=UPI001373B759|nr:hypothetical protein [Bradyrhizobium sp. LCT2]QHP67433.1 hypothetical protein EI171_08325 [Bradyrhizobium sp. LCT2]